MVEDVIVSWIKVCKCGGQGQRQLCCGLKGWERDRCEVSTDKYRDGCLFGLSFSGFLAPALVDLLVSRVVLCWSAGGCCSCLQTGTRSFGHEPHP